MMRLLILFLACFCTCIADEGYRVAILGGASLTGETDVSEQGTFRTLLKNIRSKNPSAVFCTGELVQIFENETNNKSSPFYQISSKELTEKKPLDLPEIEKRWKAAKFLVEQALGPGTPFFPQIGKLPQKATDANKELVQTFVKIFGIQYPELANDGQLGYLVSIGNALFQVYATDWPVYQKDGSLDISMLSWTASTLQERKKDFSFIFALGSQPVFSTLDTFGKGRGLGNFSKEQALFWELLREYRVLAYFSGEGKFYQRVQKGGVWHIISGGAGSTLEMAQVEPFSHYLLLFVPKDSSKAPTIEVIDKDGKTRDVFKLENTPNEIYELRIS